MKLLLFLSLVVMVGCENPTLKETKDLEGEVVAPQKSLMDQLEVFPACDFKSKDHQYTIRQRADGKWVVVFHHLDVYIYYVHFDPKVGWGNLGEESEADAFDNKCMAQGFLKRYFQIDSLHHAKYDLK